MKVCRTGFKITINNKKLHFVGIRSTSLDRSGLVCAHYANVWEFTENAWSMADGAAMA